MQNNHATHIEEETQSSNEPSNANGGVAEGATSTEATTATTETTTTTTPLTEDSHTNGDREDEVSI